MHRTPRGRRPSSALAAAVALAAAFAVARAAVPDGTLPVAKKLPRMVFVRVVDRGGSGIRGGRPDEVSFDGLNVKAWLCVREPDGRLHTLIDSPRFYDVARPVASWDARQIVFAAKIAADSSWRIWTVGADGRALTPVTRTDRSLGQGPLGAFAVARFARYDDYDPAWLPDGRIVFASTRFPQVSQRGGHAVPNLFVVRTDGTGLERITTERNAAERPTIDAATGRVVYARWFFNPYLASDSTAEGLTQDPRLAAPHTLVDQWQAVSIFPDGDRIQLAGGDPRDHDSSACYAPTVLKDGTVVGVRARGADAPPVRTGRELVAYAGGIGAGRVLVRAPSLAAPVALPDGRILFARDATGEGRFDLCVVAPRTGRVERVPGGENATDPCPLVARRVPPVLAAQGGIDDPAALLPATELAQVTRMDDTFRFDCLNVFASGPVDSPTPSAPRIARDVRIRFWATLARPQSATGDTVVLVREARVTPAGGVHESDMPGDVPMFEQLVDKGGHVLMSAHGPALVPGSNFARIESGTKCVGCHAGHSTLVVPKNYSDARWFNASPSARVTADAVRKGAAPAEALVDRVANGPIARVGWVADGPGPHSVRLDWPTPIEAREFVLYAPRTDAKARTDVRVRACTLVLTLRGKEVGRVRADHLRPSGTRVAVQPLVLDAVQLLPSATGNVDGRPATALAEIETIARLPDEPRGD